MKTLKIAAVIVVLAIAGVLGFAALQPDSFSVRRVASIKAPPEKIFPLINDFSRWGEATMVTWAMEGPTPFISKVICLFVDMDRMVGSDFEAGLANLRAIAEK